MGVMKREPSTFKDEVSEEDDMEDFIDGELEDDTDPEEEDDDDDDDVLLSEPSKTAVYNRNGLLERLEDISWPENVDWIHKLSIDINQGVVDVNDDLTRELSFYNQALEGTKQAFEKLQSMGLPFLRPTDYYAEMVKTDNHMEKVKSKLLVEKKKIEEAEERRKARDSKKIAKETQAQKTKERSKQKKDEIESVKKWRKDREKSGFPNKKDEDMALPFEDGKGFERSKARRPGVRPGDRSGGMARQGGNKEKTGMDKKWKNREHKDSKFGSGGRKGMKKQNTADTTNDLRGFNKGDSQGNKKRKR
ncbi:hypothetical protein GIB67_021331 [Kingdonia uniflora]|uniref:Uncharacterized protein n=1 Tax=Kingdonia uniflora TaxID=39325 RepID=A0A7J7KZB5_9MAGN|nr:hypothetical protein GIB67_021331 [Kingdonia uniflora]